MRRRPRSDALPIVAALAGTSCVGAPGERVGAVSQAIIGGSVDTADTAVVAVMDPSSSTLCSGTLVAPSVVLTAAHCVYLVDPSALQVLVGTDSTNPDQTIAVNRVVVYPTYAGE